MFHPPLWMSHSLSTTFFFPFGVIHSLPFACFIPPLHVSIHLMGCWDGGHMANFLKWSKNQQHDFNTFVKGREGATTIVPWEISKKEGAYPTKTINTERLQSLLMDYHRLQKTTKSWTLTTNLIDSTTKFTNRLQKTTKVRCRLQRLNIDSKFTDGLQKLTRVSNGL